MSESITPGPSPEPGYLDEMMIALRESREATTKLEAGQILANGGWAVFPLPDLMKFDHGLSYLNATTDPGIFTEMAEDVMEKNECRDVNVALAPARCAVPLMVIDLDGGEAIDSFWKEAWARGHADVGLWLGVKTTRADRGGHMYFVAPAGKAFGNGTHRWGGEIRSAKGHVVMPPSTTAIGRYAWRGETVVQAPEWVVEGLPQSAGGNYRQVKHETLGEWLDDLSQAEWTSYARTAYVNLLDELKNARPGFGRHGRNPTLSRVVNRVLDLALDYELPALEALSEIKDVYFGLFGSDEDRDLGGEFRRCVESWARNKDGLEERVEDVKGLQAWIASHGGPARKARENIALESEIISRQRGHLRSSANNWKASIGK